MEETIVVVDFGAQYSQLIARAVRKCNVYSEIVDFEDASKILEMQPKGIILSGGPGSVYEKGAPMIDKSVLELGVPVLGICYGMQLLNHLMGGKTLGRHEVKEYGKTSIEIDHEHPLFKGLDRETTVWMSHGDSVDTDSLPGFSVIGRSSSHLAAIADDKRSMYGLQFHPEVSHTLKGMEIIRNFVIDICGCQGNWSMDNFIESAKHYVRKTVGMNDVICFVSGGVDSTFVAKLLSETEGIGNVYPVYIEALMRKNETEEVMKSGINDLIVKRYEERFIEALEGISEPEEKRNIIGNLFGTIQEEIVKELGLDEDNTFLAQGTLYTDIIESGKGKAHTIKSHHNVGCEFIRRLKEKGRVVEPNRFIFKDEVRLAAKEIGLPQKIYNREPFPGPGLGIRIVDSFPAHKEEIQIKVALIAKQQGYQGYVLPVKTVGVQGDKRTYSYCAMIRGKNDWSSMRECALSITREVHDINRVVYDLGRASPNPRAIRSTVCRKNIDLLKEIDFQGRKIIKGDIQQTIFILFGVDMYGKCSPSVALRAVRTDDFMTVAPVPIDELDVDSLVNKLGGYDVSGIVYDITDKPPATTCWE